MPQSDNHDYNVPNQGDQNWHQPLNDNFRSFDTDIEVRDTDGNTGNYTPKQGAKFLATDTGRIYEGDGSNWNATLAQYRYSAPSSSSAAGNLVAGHANNSVGSGVSASTVSGGGTGSNPNQVSGSSSTVGGGEGNSITSTESVIGGGLGNSVSSNGATIGGGVDNSVSGDDATIAGGDDNQVRGDQATVGGGQRNTASGQHATVPGGEGCSAAAPNAFAAGTNASANHEGAFVYSDTSSGGLSSLNPNEFAVSAAGGVFFFTNEDATTGVELPSGSGSWSSASSRALKSNVDPVEPADVLDRVSDLEVATWNYDAEGADARHMGPMAEDFAAAFGLGDDEGKISTVDADGVAFAAIQGLAERLEDRDETIDRQRDRIDELEAKNGALEDRLAAVEAELGIDAGTGGRAVADD